MKHLIIISMALLSGCFNERFAKAEKTFIEEFELIKIGMNYSEAKIIIDDINSSLQPNERLPDEAFKKDDDLYLIKFIVCRAYDGQEISYDQYYPLVFKNDQLLSMGWNSLGGPYGIRRGNKTNTVWQLGVTYNIK